MKLQTKVTLTGVHCSLLYNLIMMQLHILKMVGTEE